MQCNDTMTASRKVNDEFILKPCIVSLIDVLGSSELLLRGIRQDNEMYLRNLSNMFKFAGKYYPSDQIKTFSDNILIYDEDDEDGDSKLSKMVNSVAQMQYQTVCDLGLLLRGAIASGGLYHSPNDSEFDDFTIGDGLVTAYNLESKKAIHPRIVMQDKLARRFLNGDGDDSLLRKQGSVYYLDYLQTTLVDGFPDESLLSNHRDALIKHINMNNAVEKNEKWDAVRLKDVWCLSYHNDFCSCYDAEEYIIDYTEAFDSKGDCIEISVRGRY